MSHHDLLDQSTLPIPEPSLVGPTTSGAKDPGTESPLRPLAGAAHVRMVRMKWGQIGLGDDAAYGDYLITPDECDRVAMARQ